jgi:hypothetical protein
MKSPTLDRGVESLAKSESRFRFLDALATETRRLTEPADVMQVSARMLGQHLRVNRCAYARVEAANSGVGAAKAAMLPTISLTALAGGVSRELSTLLSSGNSSWAGVLTVFVALTRSVPGAWSAGSAGTDASLPTSDLGTGPSSR